MPTWMFELYYQPPSNLEKEAKLTDTVVASGGWLDCREAPEVDGSYVCLTYELPDLPTAERIAKELRACGHHVEGVQLYT